MPVRILEGHAALKVADALAIADIHIGGEKEFDKAGIRMPEYIERMGEEIEKLMQASKAERLVILGDLKHSITWAGKRESESMTRLLRNLSEVVKIDIVPGNHDGDIRKILGPRKNIRFHPAQGFGYKDVYFMHGHAWPHRSFLECGYAILGHNHPVLEIRDSLGKRWVEKIWIAADMDRPAAEKIYGKQKMLPKIIFMPAFSDLAGGKPVNKNEGFLGPIAKLTDIENAQMYLLDGTYVGILGETGLSFLRDA